MKKAVAGLLIGTAVGCLAQSTDTALAILEQRRGRASASDLRGLSSGLSYDANQYRSGQEGYSARMVRAAKTLAYLNAMRNVSGMDVGMGLALANAYENVGAMQLAGSDPRYLDRNGAILSYQNSYLMLNQLNAQYPNDPRITGQISMVAGRVRALGGSLPVWVSMPYGGQQMERPTGIPEQHIPVAKGQPAGFDMPRLDWAKVPEASRKACGESLERYIGAAASAQGAMSVLDSLRMSVESRGLSLRADYITGSVRLQDRMRNARESLDHADCVKADEWLGMAEGETKRLLKDLGQ